MPRLFGPRREDLGGWWRKVHNEEYHNLYKYYIFGHHPSSCLYLKIVLFIFQKHNVSETRFCLHLQVKPTQLGPIDRASPYLRTPVPAPRLGT
jgi:hypothetical protein